MSKKSRRQRQRAKQRNYAQIYNPSDHSTETGKSPGAPVKMPLRPAVTTSATAWDQLQQGKNADLWDSLIFAGAIFVAFVTIYFVNLRTPFLPQIGTWVSNLLGFAL